MTLVLQSILIQTCFFFSFFLITYIYIYIYACQEETDLYVIF